MQARGWARRSAPSALPRLLCMAQARQVQLLALQEQGQRNRRSWDWHRCSTLWRYHQPREGWASQQQQVRAEQWMRTTMHVFARAKYPS